MIKFKTVTWYSQLLAIVLAVMIFVVGIYIGTKIDNKTLSVTDDQRSFSKDINGFAWDIKTSVNDEEIPHSRVSIVLNYEDGTNRSVFIDEITGDCNSEDTETTLALNSEQITCYYAGFGDKFRVIEENGKYLVQQLTFEEATPDNENMPLPQFETKVMYSIM